MAGTPTANDRYQIFEKLERCKQRWDRDSAESFSGDVQCKLFRCSLCSRFGCIFGLLLKVCFRRRGLEASTAVALQATRAGLVAAFTMVVGISDDLCLTIRAAAQTRQPSATIPTPLTLAHRGTIVAAKRTIATFGASVIGAELTRLAVHLRDRVGALLALLSTASRVAGDTSSEVIGLLLCILLVTGADAIDVGVLGLVLLIDRPYLQATSDVLQGAAM